MKHWEEAAILTEVLDRHAAHLTQGFSTADWTLFHHVERFLFLLQSEPVLLGLVNEYVGEAASVLNPLSAGMKGVLQEAEVVVGQLADSLGDQDKTMNNAMTLAGVVQNIRYAAKVVNDTQKAEQAFGELIKCVQDLSSTSADLLRTCHELQTRYGTLASRFVRHSTNEPGIAYLRLHAAVAHSDYATEGSPEAVNAWNERAAKLQFNIRESSLWRGLKGSLAQPGVMVIHDSVRILHLALITSLARGRSRWATVKRFAARCESLDRERLRAGLADANGKAEAFLTLEFARYLFDAGYNPLVDATACDLRPDVLDVTTEPAIYVEAKQYENIDQSTESKLRNGLAQTLNTWGRLANRWHVPEAFLLVFRRSGRPLEFESSELRVNGGRLYVLSVDLAGAVESGSRAESPMTIDVLDLLRNANDNGSLGGIASDAKERS